MDTQTLLSKVKDLHTKMINDPYYDELRKVLKKIGDDLDVDILQLDTVEPILEACKTSDEYRHLVEEVCWYILESDMAELSTPLMIVYLIDFLVYQAYNYI